jgi:hypothetical protein
MNARVNQAYDKLNGTQRNYLSMMSEFIESARERCNALDLENRKGKLRGYLTALEQMDVITHSDLQALYLFFFTESRAY